eukprot:UN02776
MSKDEIQVVGFIFDALRKGGHDFGALLIENRGEVVHFSIAYKFGAIWIRSRRDDIVFPSLREQTQFHLPPLSIDDVRFS